MITDLAPNEIFVFGSNASGQHGAGAARTALERFGAVWGQGSGLQGQSYGIDTMSGFEKIRAEVARSSDGAVAATGAAATGQGSAAASAAELGRTGQRVAAVLVHSAPPSSIIVDE